MSRFKEEEIGTRLRNGDSAPLAEAASSNSFKPHLAEQKNGKRKSDMSLEEMYNSQYDFGDDEDDDSDWEPSALPAHSVVEIPKWFCLNCTMLNIGDDSHCDVCGEHRESGILKRGFVSSASSREVVTQNGAHAADGLQEVIAKFFSTFFQFRQFFRQRSYRGKARRGDYRVGGAEVEGVERNSDDEERVPYLPCIFGGGFNFLISNSLSSKV